MTGGVGRQGRAGRRTTPPGARRVRVVAPVVALVVALLVAVVAVALPAVPASAQPRGSARVDPEVEVKAAEGEVRVIAATEVPGEQVVDEVAAALPRGSARDVSAGAAPQVVATVDAEGLAALREAPGVTAIVEDKINRPTADTWPSTIGLPATHAAGWDGTGRTVAVLDGGVQADHPYLGGRVVEEACFSTVSSGLVESLCDGGVLEDHGPGSAAPCVGITGCAHGTHVAGLAVGGPVTTPAALTGTATGASLIAVQVFSKGTSAAVCGAIVPCLVAYDSDIVEALTWLQGLRDASDPVVATLDAVNMSLGGGLYSSPCDALNPTLAPAISELRASGVATVVAAGNNGNRGRIASPACISTAVSVGATTGAGSVASFSNVSTFTTLLAPGQLMTSSVPTDGFGTMSGTSMASPVVSGAVAIMRQHDPAASVDEVVNDLRRTGDPITTVINSAPVVLPEIQLDSALLEGRLTPVTPTRLLDTRATTPVGASPRTLTVAGITAGSVTVPDDAIAVVANVTVTGPTSASYLTVYPSGSPRPTASNLNFVAGQTVPNLVVVKVGANGAVDISNFAGLTHVVVDLVGYYAVDTGSPYTPVAPTRVLDTRSGTPVGTTPRTLAVAGVTTGGLTVPADAVAVVANVTVTEPTGSSYLTVYPQGESTPTASNLNYVTGQTVPNLVVAKVGAGGAISLVTGFKTAHVVVDIVGYFGPGSTGVLTALSPRRVLDTRTGAPLAPATPRTLTVAGVGSVPADAVAVVANVTVTEPTGSSFLTVYPAGQAPPVASNLNYVVGQTVPNLVVVKVGAGGAISFIDGYGTTHVVVDIVGYYRDLP